MPLVGRPTGMLGRVHDFDKELERRGHRFSRYADDAVVLVRSQRAGERVMQSVTEFLARRLKLTVNAEKSKVVPTSECTFLGFTFHGIKIRWTEKTMTKFQNKVRQLTNRNWGIAMEDRLRILSRYLTGWMAYFHLSEYYRPLPEIDKWIRRRVRMCYWTQWRRPRTRVRNLLKLGTPERYAISCGLSSKGPWRLSKSLGTQTGMTNKWLAEQGLVSVRDLWIQLNYLR
jgi:RNA-directed DNA polymerase